MPEQGDVCLREAFGLKHIEDCAMVHRVECILDVKIQDNREALLASSLLSEHAAAARLRATRAAQGRGHRGGGRRGGGTPSFARAPFNSAEAPTVAEAAYRWGLVGVSASCALQWHPAWGPGA